MEPVEVHAYQPEVSFDGGDLDCGGGLLLLIRRHIDPLNQGGLLEILSTESTVEVELPAWCRLTKNKLVSWTKKGRQRSFLVSKGPFVGRSRTQVQTPTARIGRQLKVAVAIPETLPAPVPAPKVEPLSVMGIGSWPRPRWMLQAVHDRMEGRLNEEEFQATADDAVRLCLDAQLRAGADVLTDGEQRRDSYASFVGGLLDNCQLIPLSDLTAMVDDPEEFEQELRALDVPAGEVRHPVVYGSLGRSKPIAVHEFGFAKTCTDLPLKVALPGPYLLTRTMWMDCLTDRPYETREDLAQDIVRVLREELHFLLASGVALVQFDEPVLSEVVFGASSQNRTFMCGALSEKLEPEPELDFASALLNEAVRGLPAERLGLHICRGNWTKDESAALAGDYRPLLGVLKQAGVGTLFLELCTERAGEAEVLRDLPEEKRIGVGVVNQKLDAVEPEEEIRRRIARAIELFGEERVLLTPDCGFATFADNPVASATIAEAQAQGDGAGAGRLSRLKRPIVTGSNPQPPHPIACRRATAFTSLAGSSRARRCRLESALGRSLGAAAGKRQHFNQAGLAGSVRPDEDVERFQGVFGATGAESQDVLQADGSQGPHAFHNLLHPVAFSLVSIRPALAGAGLLVAADIAYDDLPQVCRPSRRLSGSCSGHRSWFPFRCALPSGKSCRRRGRYRTSCSATGWFRPDRFCTTSRRPP